MTNAQIIFDNSIALMERGILKGTGQFVTVVDGEGNEKQLEIPEEIHTYAVWKKLGYQVKKGEKAIANFQIWKMTIKKAKTEDEEDKQRMFMTKAFFFKREQVQPC